MAIINANGLSHPSVAKGGRFPLHGMDKTSLENMYDIRSPLCVFVFCDFIITLQWHHNGRYGVSNHQPHDCLLNRLFRRRSKKIPKLRATGLCAENSPVTGEFPAQMASNAENVTIWWRHHESWVPPCDPFTTYLLPLVQPIEVTLDTMSNF